MKKIKENELPLQVLYKDGMVTNEIRPEVAPVAFVIGKSMFGVKSKSLNRTAASRVERVEVKNKFYKYSLPTSVQAKTLYRNLDEIDFCIHNFNRLYGWEERFWTGKTVWVKNPSMGFNFNTKSEYPYPERLHLFTIFALTAL